MKLLTSASVALVILASAACSPTGPTPGLNEEFVLAPGEVASVESVDLTIRFIGVTGDSRCPADVVCIQGGDAIVHIEARSAGSTQSHELHTGNMQPVQHGSLTIALVDLKPYPFSSGKIEPNDYRVTLKVSQRPS